MNENNKIKEAKYFYSKMVEEQENRDAFTFNLSAFLSATRSALQYALKEAEQKAGGQAWYDNLMKSSLKLKFFKDKRDLNIHEIPISTKANYILHAETGGFVTMSGSVSMIVRDKDGNIKQQVQTSPTLDLEQVSDKGSAKSNPIPNEVKYYFDNWAGSEDVLTLCHNFINELESAISDGISKGYITN